MSLFVRHSTHQESFQGTMKQKIRCLCIILLLPFIQYCTSRDTITQNQSLKDGDVLVSSGNNFVLGFFSPGNSRKRYVGLWYSKDKVSEQTVVWVANRDNPVNGTTGVLSVENSGNLVLYDQSSNIKLWSANVSGTLTASSCFVQLMDTGNLVLFQDYQNTSIILWQSFDYPTNTLLPHMKQGVNLTTGLVRSLTSWKSQDDPGTGDFQLKIDLNCSPPQIFLYKNSEKLCRSGPWNGIELNGVPEMTLGYIFTLYYVENDDEVSLSYGIRDPSIFSRSTIDESGTVDRLTWQEGQQRWVRIWAFPEEDCDYYSRCGPFGDCNPYRLGEFECECLPGYEPKVKSEWYLRDGINGCTRKLGEQTCGNSSADVGFITLTSVKIPDTANAIVNRALGLKECEDLCIKNCSCTAYASANISSGGSGCITWYGDLMDTRQFPNGGQDVYIRVTASESAEYLKNLKGRDSKNLTIILVPTIAGVPLLVFAIWLALWKQKDTGHFIRKLLGFKLSPVSSYGGSSRTNEIDENGDLSVFDLKTIISATASFSSSNKLGEGGFGSVYKGKLQNGREIAIKRLSKGSCQGILEFKTEVTLIARLQHRNLVKLLGCCIQEEEKILVYEYLPNKGLDNFIFDKENGALLDWRKRFEIILGIARGIVYLHRDSRLRIIHRDLKASNILLDANMEPKISDFGMARIFGTDQMVAKTHRVVGTYGYMSPEYAMQGLFSEKSDVFSYGVLLLEIISGRKNSSYFSDNTVNLTGYVWDLWKEGNALDIVDPSMDESYNHDEVSRCIQIGFLCVQEHARDRPTMSKVLSMLCKETSLPSASPKQPAFVIKKADYERNDSPYSAASLGASVDDVTITVVEAR